MSCEQFDGVGIEERVRVDDDDDFCIREMYSMVDRLAFSSVFFCDDTYFRISFEDASRGLIGGIF